VVGNSPCKTSVIGGGREGEANGPKTIYHKKGKSSGLLGGGGFSELFKQTAK